MVRNKVENGRLVRPTPKPSVLTPYERVVVLVFEKIRKAVNPRVPVSINHDLMDDLGMDELDIVELTLELEEALEINLPEDEAQNLTTVNDVVKLVCEAQEGEAVIGQ